MQINADIFKGGFNKWLEKKTNIAMLCNFETLGGHLNGYKICYSKSQFDIKLNIIDNNKFYLFKFVMI